MVHVLNIRYVLIAVFLSASVRVNADSLFGTDSVVRPSRSYDVLHYKLQVRFEESEKKVIGKTTISLTPLKSLLDSIVLHAVSFDVTSVLLNRAKPLRWSSGEGTLTLHLDRAYSFSDTLLLAIEYTATPARGLYFLQPDSTNPNRPNQIWTQGEDIDNRHWFPCWDFPNDKATSEVIATVKDSWMLLSNGKLLGVKHDQKNKTKTFHWYQSKPHVSYLIMLAAGEYEVITERHGTIPIQYYLYKDRVDDGKRSLSATPRILKYFEEATGFPYPWDKYAQIYITDFMWGGMENTSAVTLNESYLIDRRGLLDFTADDVVAHELAHQWFGDVVTCRDWTELWLNEGFANYFEALFKKHAKGDDEYQLDLLQQSTSVLNVERTRGRKPVVSRNSFTTNLYSKGGWVLYMLHTLVGDEEFHRAINHYLKHNAYTSVSTYDLRKAVEEATGQNLDWFFDQWLYKAGHPELAITQRWDDTAKTLLLTIRQTQEMDSLTGAFIVPLDIECTTPSGKTAARIWLNKVEHEERIPLPERPLMVIVDKGMKILKTMTFEKTKEEWMYQLQHAGDISDRMAAAKALREFPEDTSVFEVLRFSALKDPFWAVRREATIYLGTMKHGAVKDGLFAIARDEKSSVRNAAVVALENFPSADVSEFLQTTVTSDSSYIVQASCLRALEKVDTVSALRLALQYVSQESHRNILRRAGLQALRALRRPEALPVAVRYTSPGNPADIRSLALGILGEEGEEDPLVRSVVLNLSGDYNATIRKGVARTLGIWGGEDSKNALQRRKEIESDPDVRRAVESALAELEK